MSANPNTFDEASAAAKEMFEENEQLSLSDAPTEDENAVPVEENDQSTEENAPAQSESNTEEMPSTAENGENQATLSEAAQIAETAAQAASEKDIQLRQAMQELEQLREANTQLQGQVSELSARNEEQLVEEILEPPTLDINALAFASEEEIKAAQAKYAEELSKFNRSQIMKELSPTLEFAKEGMREKEKNEAISVLKKIPELSGISEMLPQLDRIIENNKWLSSADMPMDEKYINAYAFAKGIEKINTKPEPEKELTADELMTLYNNNPAFQEMVEKQRISQVKNSQQVPPFSASSGAANAALNIKEKPKTFEEASKRTREMFGLT